MERPVLFAVVCPFIASGFFRGVRHPECFRPRCAMVRFEMGRTSQPFTTPGAVLKKRISSLCELLPGVVRMC